MRTHLDIDRRSLALAEAVAEVVDRDPERFLARARATCCRWVGKHPSAAVTEWQAILEGGWADIRPRLLDPGEEGCRLRQSSPFTGILTCRERWAIYRRFGGETAGA
jgi:hypothetical protein